MYSMGACAVLGMTNQDALSEDLENDPFLNSDLQRFTSKLYYRFGSFLAPLSVGIITSRHYLSERNKMEEQVETMKMKKNLLTSSKCKGPPWSRSPGTWGPATARRGQASRVIRSFIGMGLVGFCFGIGLILVFKTVNNLEYCIEELISRK